MLATLDPVRLKAPRARPPDTWSFDPATQRYRWPNTGRPVPPATIRDLYQLRIGGLRADMAKHAMALGNGQITPAMFEARMRATIKTGHIQSRLLAIGGRDKATFSDWGKVGNMLKKEYGYLRKFTADVPNLSPAQILQRAQYYAGSNMQNEFVMGQRDAAKAAGWRYKQRQGPNDEHTCKTCREEIGAGRVDIDRGGWLLGHTECGPNDRCGLVYYK